MCTLVGGTIILHSRGFNPWVKIKRQSSGGGGGGGPTVTVGGSPGRERNWATSPGHATSIRSLALRPRMYESAPSPACAVGSRGVLRLASYFSTLAMRWRAGTFWIRCKFSHFREQPNSLKFIFLWPSLLICADEHLTVLNGWEITLSVSVCALPVLDLYLRDTCHRPGRSHGKLGGR